MIMCECAYCDCPHGYPVEAGDGGDVCQPCVDGNHEGKRVYPLRYSPEPDRFLRSEGATLYWALPSTPMMCRCTVKVE